MKLTDFLTEVKIVMPREEIPEPLRDSDTIRVYHGTNDLDFVVGSLKFGATGGKKIPRIYSYENNNNPRGIFVTPDIKVAKEFGPYIIEFHARVGDLEAPVWPDGMFTVQGGMSGVFRDESEREAERMRKRTEWAADENANIRNSDRPELAATLYLFGERQALFVGDLNKNSIRAIWKTVDPTRVRQPYVRYSPSEFLKLEDQIQNQEKASEYESKAVMPRDRLTFDSFMDKFVDWAKKRKYKMSKEELTDIVVNRFGEDQIRQYVWSDRQVDEIVRDPKYLSLKKQNRE